MNESGYTSLPGTWGSDLQRRIVILVNGTPVPAVPAGSCLLLLAGLVMWAVGMLQARSTVDGIFSDLGLATESLDQLKLTVLLAVIVLSLMLVLLLAANVWLEFQWATSSSVQAGRIGSLHAYTTNARRINVANWLLLLLVALAMAGSITWLTTMSTALSATQQTGSYGAFESFVRPAEHTISSVDTFAEQHPNVPSLKAAAVPTAHGSGNIGSGHSVSAPRKGVRSVGKGADVLDMGQVWARTTCPPGCIDLGLIAQVLGLPWPCFCQVWLLGDLEEQLQKVVSQLWVAVVGALLMFMSTSWFYGYLAAQEAHATRDMQELLKTGQHQSSSSALVAA